jgi:hypothetical protein
VAVFPSAAHGSVRPRLAGVAAKLDQISQEMYRLYISKR